MAAGEGVRHMNVLRRATATRPRQAIIAVIAFLGIAAPVLMTSGDPADRTFATVSAATAVAVSGGGPGAWSRAGTIALGCVLVAIVAQFVGTGFGLLLRKPVLACAATIVVPLGLWLILGLGFLKAAQPWLTPFPSVQRLLSGDMSGLAWPQWTVMALLWAGGLNALGAARLRR